MCDLEYIGQLGSKPFSHIFTCHTHPHNFFSKEKEISICDKEKSRIESGKRLAIDIVNYLEKEDE